MLDEAVRDVLKVYDVSEKEVMLCMDALSREVICMKK